MRCGRWNGVRPSSSFCLHPTLEDPVAFRLYRLGRLSYRRRWVVLALWLLVLMGAGAAAGSLSGKYSDAFSIPGTESQEALDALDERFPEAGLANASANVVIAAPAGETLQALERRQAVAAVLDQLRQVPDVAFVSDPFTTGGLSRDGRVAQATATYDVELLGVTPEGREALFDTARPAEDVGLQVEFSGPAAQENQQEGGGGELLGVAAAAVVLLFMFGSVIAAGLPLITALVGVGIGLSAIAALTGFVELSSTAPVLALMLGLAVGIDYALFITSRYRHELLGGQSGEEAAGRAVATAGSAVVFAGLTVVIALAGLAIVNIPFLTAMGLGAAATVVVAVAVALTLLPALLGFGRKRVLGRKGRAVLANGEDLTRTREPMAARWARFVVRRKVPVLVMTVAGLAVLSIPAASLETSFPDEGQLRADTTQRKAYDLIAEGFGPGANGPLVAVVEADDPADAPAAVEAVSSRLQGVDGVAAVAPPARNPAGDTYLLTVLPTTGPGDIRTEEVVDRLRSAAPELEDQTGTRVSVTGTTAVTVDVAEKLAGALPTYLLVVVGLALALLTIVFRSWLVPLKAALGFLLTVLATFGAVVAVFQWGWLAGALGVQQTGPVLAFLPIFMIAVIFGLAMDYEVFLVTRIREEHVLGASADEAVVAGFRHGGRVVTAAALIMISVFAAFLLSPDPTTKSLGLAFAFGVLIDAFVVRLTVVPAVLALLGDRAWTLPGWLDRIVPTVDVEGSTLRVADDAPQETSGQLSRAST
jgi:RND superfamily putative drug exporter